jgi:hypothetical protein
VVAQPPEPSKREEEAQVLARAPLHAPMSAFGRGSRQTSRECDPVAVGSGAPAAECVCAMVAWVGRVHVARLSRVAAWARWEAGCLAGGRSRAWGSGRMPARGSESDQSAAGSSAMLVGRTMHPSRLRRAPWWRSRRSRRSVRRRRRCLRAHRLLEVVRRPGLQD